jgi:hypothetical protein
MKHKRIRSRAGNAVPFRERLYSTKQECCDFAGIGRRKIDQLIVEGRVDTVVIDRRRYVVVQSLLSVLEAGRNARLPEPPQMRARARAREGEAV